jgi:hypothetical protein
MRRSHIRTNRRARIAVAVLWARGPGRGGVAVVHGRLAGLRVATEGKASQGRFACPADRPCRLELVVADARTGPGAEQTRVEVRAGARSFAFFLRDVTTEAPILIPEYGVAVTLATDKRDCATLAAAVHAHGCVSELQRIEAEPEETYEDACRTNRDQICPTWLGLGRDMRFFEVGYDPNFGYWGYIRPRYHSTLQSVPETENKPYAVEFVLGPGASCRSDITRRLEDGVLPILRSTQREDDIRYDLTAFCTLETRPLSAKAVRGSAWQACYPNTGGNMLSAEDKTKLANLLRADRKSVV